MHIELYEIDNHVFRLFIMNNFDPVSFMDYTEITECADDFIFALENGAVFHDAHSASEVLDEYSNTAHIPIIIARPIISTFDIVFYRKRYKQAGGALANAIKRRLKSVTSVRVETFDYPVVRP